jgi:hypothetical protein
MSDESDVLGANDAFYAAFASGDLDALDAVWARLSPVACCHPGWEPLVGRAQVMASFRAIVGNGAPAVRCADATAHLLGEVAYVVCTETLPAGRLAATNFFVRENGQYRLFHHHAGPIAPQRAGPSKPPTVMN